MTTTRVTGTISAYDDSLANGPTVTRKIPPFSATTETPYIELVDEAFERAFPNCPMTGGTWVQDGESISESEDSAVEYAPPIYDEDFEPVGSLHENGS